MEMRRTVQVKLAIDDSDVALLEETANEFLLAANFVVEHATRRKDFTTDKLRLHHETYQSVRNRTDLNSGLVQNARNKAAEALASREARLRKGERAGVPRFTSPTVEHDRRTATFYEDHATLATTGERVRADYCLPKNLAGTPHSKYLLNDDFEVSNADLLRRNGDWFLHIRLKSNDNPDLVTNSISEHQTVLGVDCGVNNIAVTSTGSFWSGREWHHWQREFEKRRGELQQKATRESHRIIQSVAKQEQGRAKAMIHRISNELIDEAVEYGCTVIAFEDLTDIRRRKHIPWGHIWQYNQLYQYTKYKSKARAIDVCRVDPIGTSTRCSTCGFDDAENRDGESFACLECGYQNHADYNAAKNVGLRYLRGDQNGSDGGAPLGVRLNSGTLHADGTIHPSRDAVKNVSPR